MIVADFRAMVLLAFTLMVAGQTPKKDFSLPTQHPTKNTSQTPASPQQSTSPQESPAPVLVLLAVHWTGMCEATIYVTENPFLNYTSLPLSSDSDAKIQGILEDVCQKKTGCQDKMNWKNISSNADCYSVNGKQLTRTRNCSALGVTCEAVVPSDENSDLHVYKVITALLSCALLVMLLVHFTKPTVKALQRRLSERREHRWIGPTQSHSVSYHRGKTTVKNDEENRLSFQALERLAISNSSERTSTYNF